MDSAAATCTTTAQSIAAASSAAAVLNPTDSGTVQAAPVLVRDTCGGDDVSYQVALPNTVTFAGQEYSAVYATTNSTLVFGRMDDTYWDYPRTTSISVNSYDWVAYPSRGADEHLIITSSQAGFQVDLAVRPYGSSVNGTPLSTIVITAAINSDNTLSITYLSDVQAGLATRTGVRLPDGRVVTLEEAGLVRVYEAPVVTGDSITVEPSPTPSPTPEPSVSPEPSGTPTPEPTPVAPQPQPSPPVEPSPTPTEPTPTPSPTPQPTSEPSPSPTPSPEPVVEPIPQPQPTPQPEPSTPEPTPLPSIPPAPAIEPIPVPAPPEEPAIEPEPIPNPDEPSAIPDPAPAPEEPAPSEEPPAPPQEEPAPPVEPSPIDDPGTEPQPPLPPTSPTEEENSNLPPEPPIPGLISNNPDSLPDDIPKLPEEQALKPHIQNDIPGVENGGIEFYGTKTQPQVIGEDGKLTPPPPAPGSGDPIPPDAITTTETFIGQPGGTTFNAPDIAVPVVLVPLEGAIAAIPGAEAINEAFVAMANIGNDMSPLTRKKAKKILIATLVAGQISQLRRRF